MAISQNISRPIAGKIRYYEDQFLEHIENGEFSVDAEGRIWKLVDLRRGQCEPRRAEHGSGEGYRQVRFFHDGKRLSATAQRIVYRALKGRIPDGLTVNHEDGHKPNNHPDNLTLATDSEQMLHAVHVLGVGRTANQWGSDNHASKLSDSEVSAIRGRYAAGGVTMEQLGLQFGIKFQHVSRLIRGTRRRKQSGPIARRDLRHVASERDPFTGRFVSEVQ